MEGRAKPPFIVSRRRVRDRSRTRIGNVCVWDRPRRRDGGRTRRCVGARSLLRHSRREGAASRCPSVAATTVALRRGGIAVAPFAAKERRHRISSVAATTVVTVLSTAAAAVVTVSSTAAPAARREVHARRVRRRGALQRDATEGGRGAAALRGRDGRWRVAQGRPSLNHYTSHRRMARRWCRLLFETPQLGGVIAMADVEAGALFPMATSDAVSGVGAWNWPVTCAVCPCPPSGSRHVCSGQPVEECECATISSPPSPPGRSSSTGCSAWATRTTRGSRSVQCCDGNVTNRTGEW